MKQCLQLMKQMDISYMIAALLVIKIIEKLKYNMLSNIIMIISIKLGLDLEISISLGLMKKGSMIGDSMYKKLIRNI